MSRNIIHGFPKKSAAGVLPPPRLSKKPRRVFSPQRKNKFTRCLRRRVRRSKHFSRSEVSNCTPPAYNRGTERSAIPFVEEGLTFFDRLSGGSSPTAVLSSCSFIYFSFSISSGSNASNSTPYQGALGWAEVCSMQRETKSAAMTPASLRPRPRINPPTTAELKMSPVP